MFFSTKIILVSCIYMMHYMHSICNSANAIELVSGSVRFVYIYTFLTKQLCGYYYKVQKSF